MYFIQHSDLIGGGAPLLVRLFIAISGGGGGKATAVEEEDDAGESISVDLGKRLLRWLLHFSYLLVDDEKVVAGGGVEGEEIEIVGDEEANQYEYANLLDTVDSIKNTYRAFRDCLRPGVVGLS